MQTKTPKIWTFVNAKIVVFAKIKKGRIWLAHDGSAFEREIQKRTLKCNEQQKSSNFLQEKV